MGRFNTTAVYIHRVELIVNTDQQCEGEASRKRRAVRAVLRLLRSVADVTRTGQPGCGGRRLLLQEEQLRDHAVLFSQEKRLL